MDFAGFWTAMPVRTQSPSAPSIEQQFGHVPDVGKNTVMQPPMQQIIRALAEDGRAGAIGIAEHAVEAYLAGAPTEGDRILSRDILSRDLASLRGIAPHLAGFIGRVEAHLANLVQPVMRNAA